MADENPLYRILFMQNDRVYVVYAKYLSEESLMGFIEIEELIFGETSADLLIDPAEEKLRNEFEKEFKDVKRSYIPLHSILRIDEVVKEGVARVVSDASADKKSNVSHLPRK
ncbi:MAG: DUF1820 family protein [Coxiellaceae bacterium]|nr:DUF1820 family protein [Coxiellaceae bacterium]